MNNRVPPARVSPTLSKIYTAGARARLRRYIYLFLFLLFFFLFLLPPPPFPLAKGEKSVRVAAIPLRLFCRGLNTPGIY